MSEKEIGAALASETDNSTAAPSLRRSSAPRKKRKNQIPVGILVVLGMIVVGILLEAHASKLGFFWMTGGIFGFILQKSRFCFTAAMRDPFITGSTSLTRAVLIAFAITSILFTAIKFGAASAGHDIPGMGSVAPVSFGTVIGAFLFGIGMVIAGGCASGTLMRVGEGFMMQWLSLLFFVVGSVIGAMHSGWWQANVISHGVKIFLPDVFGSWMGALVVQLLVIFCLYRFAVLWERKKMGVTDADD